jgi:hypothetical protein
MGPVRSIQPPWPLILLAGSAVAAPTAGCAYSTPTTWVPPSVPSYAGVDVDASEVVVEDPDENLDADAALEVRRALAEILTDSRQEKHATGPARFRARVKLETKGLAALTEGPQLIYAPFLFLFVPFGLTLWHAWASIDLTVETGQATYRGTGSGDAGGSIYASATRRALALALQEALTNSGASAATPPVGFAR